ncbi:MAG: ATP:cob(I)alamin adenosyltransferase, partial [Bacteroidetes bacterium]|nr:ATP:cob(I)alamin adenosyltransferase [Bacteroidota bacterium]
ATALNDNAKKTTPVKGEGGRGEVVEGLVIKYLNRLSDYLFVLARMMSQELNAEEIYWKPRA